MKLNRHEIFTLKTLVSEPAISNSEIGRRLGITSQAIGKIKATLHKKGFIKSQECLLDYEKLGVDLHVIALLKVLPKALKEFKHREIDAILQPPNVIRSYSLPQTDVTHIMIYAFRNIDEYDQYFKNLRKELVDYIEIKSTFVFSSSSIVKSSSRSLFIQILEEMS